MEERKVSLEATLNELLAIHTAMHYYVTYVEHLATQPTPTGSTLRCYMQRLVERYPEVLLGENVQGEEVEGHKDTRPTFQAVCERHSITLSQLIEESGLAAQDVFLVMITGTGKPTVIDALLASLSRLSAEAYSRQNVGGLSFTLQPDYSLVPEELYKTW